jgi:hypothetical protein
MLFISKSKWLALLGALTIGAGTALAQDSGPLIDILVKKGIVTDQEAEDLRADLVRDFATNTAAGKLNLGSGLTEFRISGDLRARYESRTGELASGDHQERDRFRYRFRTALTGRVLNNWAFGARLETAAGSRSANVTMGDDAGPFAKTSDTVNIGQIYIQYLPTSDLTFTFGRMANPFVTTAMTWDADINPEGIAEAWKHRADKTEWSFTAGQFLYSAASTQNAFGAAANVDDLLMLGWQGGYKYYQDGAMNFFQINPAIYHYMQNNPRNPAAFKGTFSAANTAAVNNLFVIDVPVEYDWVLGSQPSRVFADVAVNLQGDDRATKWGRADLKNQNKAYQFGFQYGKAANRGEWDAKLAYQYVGAFALDPNLVDSDLFDSRVNMKGLIFTGDYALGGATLLTVTVGNAEQADKSLIAPGTGDIGANNALDKYWLLQVDLNLKF